MTCIMRIIHPPELEDQYVRSFDFEANDGLGYGVFTRDPRKAMRFEDPYEAMQFWNRTSRTKPLRTDGELNKPLSASTVEIVTL